eukprot:scaffold70_cov124-Skeletonema_dohrnii-CCMP3373.AAC.4
MENPLSSLLNVGDGVVLRELKPASLNGGRGKIVEVYGDGRYRVHLEQAKISIPLNKEKVSLDSTPPVVAWSCEFCTAVFRTYDETASHELKCTERGINKLSEAQRAKKLKREEEGRRLRRNTTERRNDMIALSEIATNIQKITEQGMLKRISTMNLEQIKRNGCFHWSMYKCRMVDYFEYIIPAIVIGIRTVSESFSAFAIDAPSHHPYHQHEKVLLNCAEELDQIASECRPLYTAFPDFPTTSVPAPVTIFVQHICQSIIPALKESAKKMQDLIAFPEHRGNLGPFYSKRHAIKAAIKFPKGSHARGDAIRDMVHMGVVPSQSSLYRAINDVEEEGNAIIDSKWPTGGKTTKQEVLYIETKRRWEPIILLPVIPVDCDRQGKPILDKKCVERLFSPPDVLALNNYIWMPKTVQYWGARFYFSPKQFPTPVNLQDAGKASDKTFKKLKKYMLKWFEDAKSPVICNGGKPGSKKFVCCRKRKANELFKANLRNSERSSKENIDCSVCGFSVTVKWDRLGYYIPVYNHKHNCHVCNIYHTHDPTFVPLGGLHAREGLAVSK